MLRAARRAVALALIAGVGGCGASGPPEPLAGPASPRAFFGVNGDELYRLAIANRFADLNRQTAGIEAGGLSFVRSPAEWATIQPRLTTFDFSVVDRFVATLARHHIRWQPIASGLPTPQWAAAPAVYAVCGFRSAPAQPGFLASYIAALASRYGRGGTFWKDHPQLPALAVDTYEVWNEPNHGAFWCPAPDPSAYAANLKLSAIAIHQIDPGAHVVLGGLSTFPSDSPPGTQPPHTTAAHFLAAVSAALPDLPNLIDEVGVHPYAPTPDEVMAAIRGLRQTLDENGLAKAPMSVNEAGWTTASTATAQGTSEDDRAVYMRDLTANIARERAALDISEFAPYAWITAESDPAQPNEFYGIADPESGQLYDSGEAFTGQVRALEADRGQD